MDGRETDEEYPIVGSPANPRGSIFVYPSQAVPSNTCFPSGLRMALRKQMVRGKSGDRIHRFTVQIIDWGARYML
jgi:hypothetical protein